MIQTVGIVAHRNRPEALQFAQGVQVWLQQRGLEVRLDPTTAYKIGAPELALPPDVWDSVDMIVTLGGDGTILTAARMAARSGTPILGVHMGRFGFIAESHPTDLYAHLEKILDGRMRVEERIMVLAEVFRHGNLVHSGLGLNDALVKSVMSHMLNLKTYFGGALFATYSADGVLISTPTGSTAYALSAGAPLVVPTVQALILTPICPHTLSARPLVVPADEQIEIEIESDSSDILFAVDGVDPFTLLDGDRVSVRRAEYVTRLITVDDTDFYRKVRARYRYGERLNE